MACRVKVDTHVVLGLKLGQDGAYGLCVLFGRVQVVHGGAHAEGPAPNEVGTGPSEG